MADDPHDERRAQIVARIKEIAVIFEGLSEEAMSLADEIEAWGEDDVLEVDVAHWNDGTEARH